MVSSVSFTVHSEAPFAGYASFQSLLQPLATPLQTIRQRLIELNPPETRPLAESMAYTLASTGKLMRPALTLLCYQALTQQESIPDAVLEVATVSELIHVATLLHDDVLDEADLRRGKPTVRQKFGNTLAILGGDWLLAQASKKLALLGHLPLVAAYADVLAALCDGEVEQLRGRNLLDLNNPWPTYWRKSKGKTASLFATSCQSAAFLAQAPLATQQAFYTFGETLGLAFQLVDDTLDYESTAEQLGKPALADLDQGLMNAPLLLALESQALNVEQQQQLKETLSQFFEQQSTTTAPATAEQTLEKQQRVQTVLSLMQQANALEATRTLAATTLQQGLNGLEGLVSASPYQQRLLQLAQCLVLRTA